MIRNPHLSTLIIQVQTGVNAAGKPVLKAKSYPMINPSATDDAINSIGQALASLQSCAVTAIERIDRAALLPDPAAAGSPAPAGAPAGSTAAAPSSTGAITAGTSSTTAI